MATTYRKKGHDIQIVWLQDRELVLLDRVEDSGWGRTRNVYVKGHPGDALIIETTATEQKFYFLTKQEVDERFEADEAADDVYYERIAPRAPSRRQPPALPRRNDPYVMPPAPMRRAFSGITVDPDALEAMTRRIPGAVTEEA